MSTVRALTAMLLLGSLVACSPSSPASSDSELLAIARKGYRAAEEALLRPYGEHSYADRRFIPNVVMDEPGIQKLRESESPSCSTGVRTVYALSGNADALWARMLGTDGTIEQGRTTTGGRSVRVIVESGFDYSITAALIDETANDPALLVVDGCS